jgi:predicted metalloendopeptidase
VIAAKATTPGEDFYAFVNAGDLQAMTLPPGAWERGNFDIVRERVTADIETLVKQASPDGKAGHEARVGRAYRALLDEAAIEAGLPRLRGEVAGILTAATPGAVAAIMAHPRSSSLVGIFIAPAEGEWMLHMDQQNQAQPMLGLSGELYEGTDGRAAEVRRAYLACIAELLTLAGAPDGARRAADVLSLETQIARRQWSPERLRDRRANIHVMSVEELQRFAPGLPWSALLEARGLSGIQRLNLGLTAPSPPRPACSARRRWTPGAAGSPSPGCAMGLKRRRASSATPTGASPARWSGPAPSARRARPRRSASLTGRWPWMLAAFTSKPASPKPIGGRSPSC